MLVGLCGKTNVGKTTFFNALTLANAKIAPHPFTTIKPNEGIGFVRVKCACKEYGVNCTPRTGFCLKGERFVPVKVMDVAGLVRGAHEGRGLGNKFLDDLRRSDVNILVIDASGLTDSEGNPCQQGLYNPLEDIKIVMDEFSFWVNSILKEKWRRIIGKLIQEPTSKIDKILFQELSGLGLKKEKIKKAIDESRLTDKKPQLWSGNDLLKLSRKLVEHGKPFIIAANKSDVSQSEDNIKKIIKKGFNVVPTSSEAELALKRASSKGIIEYIPGDPDFKVLKGKLPENLLKALKTIKRTVLDKWGSTGVQKCVDKAVFEVLNYLAVFPVEDEKHLTDHEGKTLPDVYLVPKGTTAKQLAGQIHTDLQETFLFAYLVREKRKVGADYQLKHRDIIKITAARGRK